MAAPPPPPPPDPPSTVPLPHPTSNPSPYTQFLSPDLVSIGPDLAASGTVPNTTGHLLPPQPSHPPSSSRSNHQRSSSARAHSRSGTPDQFPPPSAASGFAPGSAAASSAFRSEFPHLPSSSLAAPHPPVLAPAQLQAAAQSVADSTSAGTGSIAAQSAPDPSPSAVLTAGSAATGSAAAIVLPAHLQAAAQFPPKDSTQPALTTSAPANLQAAPQSVAPQPVQQAVFPLHPPFSVINSHQQVLPHQLSAAAPQPLSSSAIPRRPASASSLAAASHSGPILSSTPTSSPPQQQTYAQVARNSRGPGFIRSHASAVESFARLPRTGINIICGTREGMPSFSFINSELPKIEELYVNALVMKFHGGRPSLEASHKEIQSWGIEHPFSIGPLSSRAYLLRFQDNVDLLKVLTRPSTILITFPYKVYRWHNLCHMKEDSCLAPVWISLPGLPLQCFVPEFLESVANRIGRFLCFDKATSTLARPSAARICVEIDLRKAPPPFIWVGLYDGFKQQIIYERMPKYCNLCHVIGHVAEGCLKASQFTHSFHMDQRVPASRSSAASQRSQTQPFANQQVSRPVVPPPPPALSHLHPPSSAATNPSEAHSAADLLQQAPAAAETLDAHPHAQQTSTYHQRTPVVPTSAALFASSIQQPAAAFSHVEAQIQLQPSASLLQNNPAAVLPNYPPPLQQNLSTLPSATSQPSESELPQSSSTRVQQVSNAAGTLDAHFSAQQTDSLLQSELAAAAQPSSSSNPSSTLAHISGKRGPSETQPLNPLKPPSSTLPKYRKGKQKRKSVSFAHPLPQQQSNIQANLDFWEAANHQLATIEQDRHPPLSAPSPQHLAGIQSLASSDPIISIQPPQVQVVPSGAESDSGSSIAADTPPSSPDTSTQDADHPTNKFRPISHESEGEDPAESSRLSGHDSDDQLSFRPHRSNRNKRHPDQPLNVHLRARKGSTSTALC